MNWHTPDTHHYLSPNGRSFCLPMSCGCHLLPRDYTTAWRRMDARKRSSVTGNCEHVRQGCENLAQKLLCCVVERKQRWATQPHLPECRSDSLSIFESGVIGATLVATINELLSKRMRLFHGRNAKSSNYNLHSTCALPTYCDAVHIPRQLHCCL